MSSPLFVRPLTRAEHKTLKKGLRQSDAFSVRRCQILLASAQARMSLPTKVMMPPPAVVKQAKLGVVIDDWMRENDLQASAIQCWTSLQKNNGVNVCTLMSFMSDQLMPSACEVDVTGVASMYALQLASGKPAALVDWNNNYADDPDKCVLFHCGNWAKTFYPDVKMANAPSIWWTRSRARVLN